MHIGDDDDPGFLGYGGVKPSMVCGLDIDGMSGSRSGEVSLVAFGELASFYKRHHGFTCDEGENIGSGELQHDA